MFATRVGLAGFASGMAFVLSMALAGCGGGDGHHHETRYVEHDRHVIVVDRHEVERRHEIERHEAEHRREVAHIEAQRHEHHEVVHHEPEHHDAHHPVSGGKDAGHDTNHQAPAKSGHEDPKDKDNGDAPSEHQDTHGK